MPQVMEWRDSRRSPSIRPCRLPHQVTGSRRFLHLVAQAKQSEGIGRAFGQAGSGARTGEQERPRS